MVFRIKKTTKKSRLALGIASLALAAGSAVAVAAPANASSVNYYECAPSTGYCVLISDYTSGGPNSCQWNEWYSNDWGMWYTNCSPGWWRPYVGV